MSGIRLKTLKNVGKRFGRLTVLQVEHSRDRVNSSGNSRCMAYCKCKCGKLTYVYMGNLIQKTTTSCGCINKDKVSKAKITHAQTTKKAGGNSNPIYKDYINAYSKCYKKNNVHYKNYGAEGIIFCDRWVEPDNQGLYNFIKDVGRRPGVGYRFCRIDLQGDYEPGNVEWRLLRKNKKRIYARKSSPSLHTKRLST